MYFDRVTKLANGRKVIRKVKMRNASRPRAKVRATISHRRKAANPAPVMVTLGFLNPKRGTKVTKNNKKRKAKVMRRAVNRARTQNRRNARRSPAMNHRRRISNKRRNSPRVVVIHPRSNRRRNRRNPYMFGSNVPITKLAEYIAGGLIGVAINKAILPMLPATLTSNNFAATATSIVIAIAEWWGASFLDKDFGAAVGFGALMNAAAQGLNAFIPSVGSYVSGLSGRGISDFVPGRFAVPQNPVLDANGGLTMGGAGQQVAYPAAYRVAA
jgi:hypothetical protein